MAYGAPMADKPSDLVIEILRLPREDREWLMDALEKARANETSGVRDNAARYNAMTLVTVALPDELAKQAEEAGLLAGRALEQMLRHALQAQGAGSVPAIQFRRLVEKNGYLVAEALPGENPITTEEVKKILDDMEW